MFDKIKRALCILISLMLMSFVSFVAFAENSAVDEDNDNQQAIEQTSYVPEDEVTDTETTTEETAATGDVEETTETVEEATTKEEN